MGLLLYNKSSPVRNTIRDLQYWLQGVRTSQKYVKKDKVVPASATKAYKGVQVSIVYS